MVVVLSSLDEPLEVDLLSLTNALRCLTAFVCQVFLLTDDIFRIMMRFYITQLCVTLKLHGNYIEKLKLPVQVNHIKITVT